MSKWFLAIVLVFCSLPSYAQGGTLVDTNKTYWNPANWDHFQDGSTQPCVNVNNAAGGYISRGYDNIVGPAGEPSPCSYAKAGQGNLLSGLAPLLATVLSVLVVILAIWTGPGIVKRLLVSYSH